MLLHVGGVFNVKAAELRAVWPASHEMMQGDEDELDRDERGISPGLPTATGPVTCRSPTTQRAPLTNGSAN